MGCGVQTRRPAEMDLTAGAYAAPTARPYIPPLLPIPPAYPAAPPRNISSSRDKAVGSAVGRGDAVAARSMERASRGSVGLSRPGLATWAVGEHAAAYHMQQQATCICYAVASKLSSYLTRRVLPAGLHASANTPDAKARCQQLRH